MTRATGEVIENADIDRERRSRRFMLRSAGFKLNDFLKTCVKIGGSDLHLQAGSVPMIRVDGRARFLDCPPPDDEAMKEYVDADHQRQAEPENRKHAWNTRARWTWRTSCPGSRAIPHEHFSQPARSSRS